MLKTANIRNLLVVELILHGAHHGDVVRTRKMCFISACYVHTVIFSKKFLYFMRIYKSDFGSCGIQI
jgi:hypothetical protein